MPGPRSKVAFVVALGIASMVIIYYEGITTSYLRRRDQERSRYNTSHYGLSHIVAFHRRLNETSKQYYHNRTVSIECQTILDGDYAGIRKLRNNSDFPWREANNDSHVFDLAANCEVLRQRYRFPPFFAPKVSVEELDFPIAYSLLAHENVNQILVLLSAIYREHNIHCIHVDAKTSDATYETIVRAANCFPNIFVSTVRLNVIYAHVSRLLADIACMKDLLRLSPVTYNWKYLINLCSQDFPTRTNLETVRQLKEFKGFNSIGGYLNINKAVRARTLYVWKVSNLTRNGITETRPICTNQKHAPPPFNMTVVKNLAYNFYTREFLQWALFDSEVGPALLEWSNDTFSPDEHYWLMLNRYPGAPGGTAMATGYQLARKIVWGFGNTGFNCHGQWRHGICVFGAEDISQVHKTNALFINKFDVTVDSTGPTCLRQLLDERVTIPNDKRNDTNKDLAPNIPPASFFGK